MGGGIISKNIGETGIIKREKGTRSNSRFLEIDRMLGPFFRYRPGDENTESLIEILWGFFWKIKGIGKPSFLRLVLARIERSFSKKAGA